MAKVEKSAVTFSTKKSRLNLCLLETRKSFVRDNGIHQVLSKMSLIPLFTEYSERICKNCPGLNLNLLNITLK